MDYFSVNQDFKSSIKVSKQAALVETKVVLELINLPRVSAVQISAAEKRLGGRHSDGTVQELLSFCRSEELKLEKAPLEFLEVMTFAIR